MEQHLVVNPETEEDEIEVKQCLLGNELDVNSDYVQVTFVDENSTDIVKKPCEASAVAERPFSAGTENTFSNEGELSLEKGKPKELRCKTKHMDEESCHREMDEHSVDLCRDASSVGNKRNCHDRPFSDKDNGANEENAANAKDTTQSQDQVTSLQDSASLFQNSENEKLEFSRSNSRVDEKGVVNMYENPWPIHFESETSEVAFTNLLENPDLKVRTEVYVDLTEKTSVRPKQPKISSSETLAKMDDTRKWCLWTIVIAMVTALLVSAVVCTSVVYLLENGAEREQEMAKAEMLSSDEYQRTVPGMTYALSMSDSRMHLYLDQKELKDHGKLLWTGHDLQDAFQTPDIRLSTSGGNGKFGCAEVSKRGFYQIVSHITFRFYKQTKARQIYHAINLENNGHNRQILKNLFTLPVKHSRSVRAILPSVLFGFQLLNPGDRICVTVSDTSLVFASVTDNYFTLVKM